MSNILVVDDDPQVLKSIRRVLEDAAFEVDATTSGTEALATMAQERPALVILDIIMPEMSGIEVCKRLRADPYLADLPVIFLTAKGRPVDVAEGLDIGADDYLVKPFEVVELPARVRALLRRTAGGTLDVQSDRLQVGTLSIDKQKPEVWRHEEPIELTPIEHRLLHYLMMHAGQPMSIAQLLQDVWEYPKGVGDPKLVRVHIVNLRNKIEPNPEKPEYVLNIRGRGYMVVS